MATILLSLHHSGYLRHYGRPVEILDQRGHRVVVVVGRWEKDAGDAKLVDDLVRRAPGVVVVEGPARPRSDPYRALAWLTRSLADLARYSHPRYEHASALRARIAGTIEGHLRTADVDPVTAAVARRLVRGLTSRTSARLADSGSRFFLTLHDAIPASREVTAFIEEHDAEVVAASPVVELGSPQVEYLRSARTLGLPTAICVASWDNLTNKGLMRFTPDLVVVWNEIQRGEAVELHGIPASSVVTTGAQRFDWWFEGAPSRDAETFRREVGLPQGAPYLLYVCSSPFVAPDEVSFVRRWIETLRASSSPLLAGIGVLVRPHPQNAAQWRGVDLSDSGGAVVFPKEGAQADDERARADYFDSMCHCAAVVGINTSAQVEAAILSKPVFTVTTSEYESRQDGTLHFHYLLWENGGIVRRATSLAQHITQLESALGSPADDEQVREFAKSFIRPHGLDVEASPLVADALESLVRGRAHPSPTTSWRTRAARPVVTGLVGARIVLARVTPRRRRGDLERLDDPLGPG